MGISGSYYNDGVFTVDSGETPYKNYFFVSEAIINDLQDAGSAYGDSNNNGIYDSNDKLIGPIVVISYKVILDPNFTVTGIGTWYYDEISGVAYAIQNDGTPVGEAKSTDSSDIWGRLISSRINYAEPNPSPLLPPPSRFAIDTADIIENFNPKTSSLKIDVSEFVGASATFKACKKTAKLEKLATKDISFLYDRQTGYLHYDANGAEIGFGAGGVFAILEGAPKLNTSAVDFV